MTEQTLRIATEIKSKLDAARKIQSDLEYKRKLCNDKFSNVANGSIQLMLIVPGGRTESVHLGSNAAISAIDVELEITDKLVKELETEFEKIK